MKRLSITPRNNWQKIVEDQGFLFHTLDDVPYWDETACYKFNREQIDTIEAATAELHEMFIGAAQHIVDTNKFNLLGIPEAIIPLIKKAWNNSDSGFWSLYGRFDLAYDGVNPPKLLEFNADTPTSLFEASIVQWFWLQDYKAGRPLDQFNSIDEKLVDAWKFIHERYQSSVYHFACLKNPGGRIPAIQLREDITTTGYVLDAASRAGLAHHFMDIGELHWTDNGFVDNSDKVIETLFKLYPWEHMVSESAQHIVDSSINWIEPIWKMLWSNKAILPILWQLYPNNKYLLKASFNQNDIGTTYVKKPFLSREGPNVTIVENGTFTENGNEQGYGAEGFIYQELANIPCFENNYPILGSWVIGGEAAGLGIRESGTRITGNTSRFIPHYFE